MTKQWGGAWHVTGLSGRGPQMSRQCVEEGQREGRRTRVCAVVWGVTYDMA